MRRTKVNQGFIICLLFNMLLNFEWSIPAWLLLIAHFVFGWSLWFFWLAFLLWIGGILIWMYVIGWATQVGNEKTPELPNKNPYSARNSSVSERQNEADRKK